MTESVRPMSDELLQEIKGRYRHVPEVTECVAEIERLRASLQATQEARYNEGEVRIWQAKRIEELDARIAELGASLQESEKARIAILQSWNSYSERVQELEAEVSRLRQLGAVAR